MSTAETPIYGPMSELSPNWGILPDSGVFCAFINEIGISRQFIFELIEAVTGWKISEEEWIYSLAKRILHIQRATLLLGGPDIKWYREHDENPPRFYEPLPSGPKKGSKIVKDEVANLIREYYLEVGWDESGIPKEEELKHLGLDGVARKLKELRL